MNKQVLFCKKDLVLSTLSRYLSTLLRKIILTFATRNQNY